MISSGEREVGSMRRKEEMNLGRKQGDKPQGPLLARLRTWTLCWGHWGGHSGLEAGFSSRQMWSCRGAVGTAIRWLPLSWVVLGASSLCSSLTLGSAPLSGRAGADKPVLRDETSLDQVTLLLFQLSRNVTGWSQKKEWLMWDRGGGPPTHGPEASLTPNPNIWQSLTLS